MNQTATSRWIALVSIIALAGTLLIGTLLVWKPSSTSAARYDPPVTVTVTEQGIAVADPDRWNIHAVVNATAPSARQAEKEASRVAERVVKTLHNESVAQLTIHRSQYFTRPSSMAAQPTKAATPPAATFTTFQHLMIVTGSKPETLQLMDALVSAGGENIHIDELVSSYTQHRILHQAASDQAIVNARHLAQNFANASHMRLGRQLTVVVRPREAFEPSDATNRTSEQLRFASPTNSMLSPDDTLGLHSDGNTHESHTTGEDIGNSSAPTTPPTDDQIPGPSYYVATATVTWELLPPYDAPGNNRPRGSSPGDTGPAP